MKKILLAFSLLLFTFASFGQQFSQYNSGTVYDSFENPSRGSFTPDSSRRYSFNFFIPNITASFYANGNSQVALKSRAFLGSYNITGLTIEQNRFNRVRVNGNIYLGMFKMFTNLDGSAEMGLAWQVRTEGRGIYSDETVALYAGVNSFPKNKDHYDDIFNNSATYQSYHQVSYTYREQINRQFAIGVKLSALMGIQYQKANVTQSSIDFDRLNDYGVLVMGGKYVNNYVPGGFNSHDYIPTLRNPGTSISIGGSLRTRDAFNLQLNVKDLGFIHWSKLSSTYNFLASDTIKDLSTSKRENNIYDAAKNITHSNGKVGSFVTPTNAKIELSANKLYLLGSVGQFKYSPTLILQKEMFFPGFTAAIVNPVSYNNYTLSMTASYDNYQIFNVGGQFMVKSPNAEFFIGSESLVPTGRLAIAAGKNAGQITRPGWYAGADIFMGVSFKFGSVIEHPLNANYIPMEEKRPFFVRLWNRIFKKED